MTDTYEGEPPTDKICPILTAGYYGYFRGERKCFLYCLGKKNGCDPKSAVIIKGDGEKR